MQIRTALAIAALAFGLATSASAQTIDSVTPDNGTLGTLIDIDFTGDIGKGKPKVWLTLAGDESLKPKKYPLKVTEVVASADSATLTVELKKAVAGLFDLHIRRKGKGLEEDVSIEVFTVNPPSAVGGPSPASAEPGDEVTLTLDDLGNKKPKVTVGGKKTKVTTVVDAGGGAQTITFKIPKSLANGNWPIVVSNKAAALGDGTVVGVTGSTKKIGKSIMTAVVDGQTLVFKGKKLGVQAAGDGLQILGTSLTNPSRSVAIVVPFVQLGVVDQGDLASISYTESSFNGGIPNVTIWMTNIPAIEIDITSVSGGQFAGTFTGTLVNAQEGNVSISGEFVADASE